jgi:hypothetical protein
VVDHCVGGREDRAASPRIQDLSASLLHARNEAIFEPLSIDEFGDGFAFDGDGVDGGVLGGRVVAEHVDSLNVFALGVGLEADLADGPVVVQSAEAGDVSGVDSRCEVAEHVGVGVGWVGHHQALDVLLGSGEGFALLDENLFICLQKVFAFHAGFAGKSAKEDHNVGVFEHFFGFVSVLDLRGSKGTDLRRGKSQSSSSSMTPLRTLTAWGMSSRRRWRLTPGKTLPLQRRGMKE